MTLPRTVSDVVAEHTVFEIECIDWMYLNVYVPHLQYAAGIVGYVHRQLGLPIASTAPRRMDAPGPPNVMFSMPGLACNPAVAGRWGGVVIARGRAGDPAGGQ
ncbi:MAG: hypothetical protein ABI873_03850, partial [Marmoricola sp.]